MNSALEKMSKNLVVLNFAPVICIYCMVWLIWLAVRDSFLSGYLALIELVYNLLVLPVFLLVENYKHNISNKKYNFLSNFLLILSALFCSECLFYVKGILTGLLKPEIGLLPSLPGLFLFSLLFVAVIGIVLHIVFNKKAKANMHS